MTKRRIFPSSSFFKIQTICLISQHYDTAQHLWMRCKLICGSGPDVAPGPFPTLAWWTCKNHAAHGTWNSASTIPYYSYKLHNIVGNDKFRVIVCRWKIDFYRLNNQTNWVDQLASEFILTLLSGLHKKPFSEREKYHCKIKITLQHAYLN